MSTTTPPTTTPAGTPIEGAAALVTGGNRGCGRAIVDELLLRGATKVYATSRSPYDSHDERIVPLVLDVAELASRVPLAQQDSDLSTANLRCRQRAGLGPALLLTRYFCDRRLGQAPRLFAGAARAS
jgi:NAD(P)-dependent dehydrogenase (short-subunit alcohol dehydrogenase family)